MSHSMRHLFCSFDKRILMKFKESIWLVLFAAFAVTIYVFLWTEGGSPLKSALKDDWESPIAYQEPPEGLNSLASEDCGVCHQDHYEEWSHSTHAQA